MTGRFVGKDNLERIIAKNKGYSAPRCAYCTDEIKEEEDAKFSTLSDGKKYPVHKMCQEESKKEPSETLEELTARTENWARHAAELEQELDYRSHTNGKRIFKHIVSAFVPGSTIYERVYERIRDGPDDWKGINPYSPLYKLMIDIMAVSGTLMATYDHNYVAAAGIYLMSSAMKPLFDYAFKSIDTYELKKKTSFAKDHSAHLQEKLAQMPPDKAGDKTSNP